MKDLDADFDLTAHYESNCAAQERGWYLRWLRRSRTWGDAAQCAMGRWAVIAVLVRRLPAAGEPLAALGVQPHLLPLVRAIATALGTRLGPHVTPASGLTCTYHSAQRIPEPL